MLAYVVVRLSKNRAHIPLVCNEVTKHWKVWRHNLHALGALAEPCFPVYNPLISPSPAPHEQVVPHDSVSNAGGPMSSSADRTPDEVKADNALAERLSAIIEDANERLLPLCNMIRKNIESFERQKEDDRDEAELVKQVRPLIEQVEKVLHETNGAVKGADPDNRLSNKAKRHVQDHKAAPEEQRLAEALKTLLQEVQGTIDWAKDKLDSFPKAKKDLGPLLDALGQPLAQIVGGVGFLLAGVLNLLGKLLSGLGLDSLLKGIISATLSLCAIVSTLSY